MAHVGDRDMKWVGVLLMVAGTFFFLAGTVGFTRLPDLYTRMHALSKSDTLGAALSLFGVACFTGWSLLSVKFVFVAVFILVANPTATHALARAALLSGEEPWVRPTGDDEKGVADGEKPVG